MLDTSYLTLFIGFFVLVVLAMKTVAVKSAGQIPFNFSLASFLFKTPLMSVKTTKQSVVADEQKLKYLIKRMLGFTIAFFGMYWAYKQFFTFYKFPDIAKAYTLPIFIYIITSYISVCAQVLCLPTGIIPTDMHNHPLLSKNIREFWSLRWNVWIRDWLNVVSKRIYKGKSAPTRAFIAFLFSGIFHEIMFQVPYGIYSGNWIIGPMLAYFVIQWIGLMIDLEIKSIASTKMRRSLMWIFLIIPSPLFINHAFLYFLGF